MGTGVLLKTFKTGIIGRPQSVNVSDILVLFPVGTGVMLNIDITGRPKSITVWFQISFCFQWIMVFCSKVKDWEMK